MSIEHRHQRDSSQYAAAVDAFTSEGGRQPSGEATCEMVELGVEHEGGNYYYKGYRYERLEDAIAYARLRRSRPAEEDFAAPGRRSSLPAPTDSDRVLMATLGIQFDGRTFRHGGFRYDRLSDAVSNAHRAARAMGDTRRSA